MGSKEAKFIKIGHGPSSKLNFRLLSYVRRNDDGLHLASRQGNLETVMYLIETLKMDPAVKGDYGRNSFLYACYGGKLEIRVVARHSESSELGYKSPKISRLRRVTTCRTSYMSYSRNFNMTHLLRAFNKDTNGAAGDFFEFLDPKMAVTS